MVLRRVGRPSHPAREGVGGQPADEESEKKWVGRPFLIAELGFGVHSDFAEGRGDAWPETLKRGPPAEASPKEEHEPVFAAPGAVQDGGALGRLTRASLPLPHPHGLASVAP